MCPRCGEALVTFELQGIEVDQCQACSGAWLDAGELEEIAERAGIKAATLRESFKAAGTLPHGKRKCVRCRASMTGVSLGEVLLDRCPYGHGIWFDKGEMAAIVKMHQVGVSDFLEAFFGEMFGTALAG
ncbi:MAG TPA: zf-TFIIB domain-containing protein [Planctomycetota bacterium]|nr:zf-TFIIB domain-containing protein [Planctomycetota bacterium]